jgi:HTH-type transcriptional regulator, sugar sensing transcriptional regulator
MEKIFSDLLQMTVEALNSMGLTVYEAKAYLALLQKHPSHGNEISRRSGVPGSKIYETLNHMMQKGLVAVLNTNPQMYSPLPHREFLKQKKEQFLITERILTTNLKKVSTSAPDIAIWQLTDHSVLLDKCRELIDGAKKSILTSLWREQGELLAKSLATAQQRGVKIISIQFGPEYMDIGKVFRHIQIDTLSDRHSGEFTIVVDESVGMFIAQPPNQEWNGLWTTNPGVVKLMTNYIRHDIYSNKLIHLFEKEAKSEYGNQLQNLLDIEIE